MPVSPTYPGVYVQEVPSGVRTIAGVSTSIPLFIGRTVSGPIGQPVQCFNYTDFKTQFGDDTKFSDLPRQVKMFYLNCGGSGLAYVMRIAKGAAPAKITLKNEHGDNVLDLIAKNAGSGGNAVRAIVTYDGDYPEATFNLEVFRWSIDAAGNRSKADRETWTGLSMDPASGSYAPRFLGARSNLVSAVDQSGGVPAFNGYSLSGSPIEYIEGGADDNARALSFRNKLVAAMGTGTDFRISIDGGAPVLVKLGPANLPTMTPAAANLATMLTDLASAIKARVDAATGGVGPSVTVDFPLGPLAVGAQIATRYLRISSMNSGDIHVYPAVDKDVAAPWQLGKDNGGIEVGAFAAKRPAPSGLTFSVLDWSAPTTFTATTPINHLGSRALPAEITAITLDQFDGTSFTADAVSTAFSPASRAWKAPGGIPGTLGFLRDKINAEAAANAKFKWSAKLVGSRLSITWSGDENHLPAGFGTTPGATDLKPDFTVNASAYSLGPNGAVGLQGSPAPGTDGIAPTSAEYDAAYPVVDQSVDLFNLLILPADAALSAATRAGLWGPASVFCQKRRAFLIMDPGDAWVSPQTAASDPDNARKGIVKDYSAVYFPRLLVPGEVTPVNPAGAIAGLMARIDGTRGVWKAPAGLEADLRGVIGVDVPISDDQHGVLNPIAINVVRNFPDGVVSWGARTNAGSDATPNDYKYVPVRRLALFLEESLYRGLKWVVFEPNDEPLWAQIRLNAGAFMHDQFRKGAFQGTKPSDAYFVKCDAETTTQTDRNLGIVNIWVGFAPLKPAEFVIIYLQQIAGQIQT